jgi:hypothetical protein
MTTRIRARRAYRLLELAFSLVFLLMVFHHVSRQEFKPLVALCAPILILYFGFASLLFVRGRALVEGPWQFRSLLAGERAMQAAVWHVVGIVLGMSAYGMLRYLEVPSDSTLGQSTWLLVFAAPYLLMQAGLLSFLRAVWLVAPHLARPLSAFELRRRISLQGRR